jgi:hypothetical protein
MSTNFGWGAGEFEDSYEALDQQEAYGTNEASSYQQSGYGQQESGYGEFEGQYGESGSDTEGVFDESEEMELAADLLSLGNEMELEQAVGTLMRSAARAVGGSINKDVGMALGTAIKAAAQQALSASGTPAASGELFGIETEGLSGEDQEFEIMRRLVRFAGAAAGRAARAPRGMNPRAIARSSFVRAARRWAPGLLRRFGNRFRRPGWQRRRWHGMRHRWGMQPPGYGYGYPYGQQPYPGAQPPYPGAPQPQSPSDPNAAGAFGGAMDPSGSPMTQGMPDAGGSDSSAPGADGPVPQAGRWTRQGGQLTIHL